MRRFAALLLLLSACAGEPPAEPTPTPKPLPTAPPGAYPDSATSGLPPSDPLPDGVAAATPTPAATPAPKAPPAATRTAPPGSGVVEVTESVLAEQIVDRRPKNPGSSFAEGGRVYLFNRFDNPGGQRRVVQHVWYSGDTERNRIDLTLKGETWRTWSYSTVYGKGPWRVDVLDGDRVIDRKEFTVR